MAIIFDSKKKGKKAKAATNHTYSGFWLDKDAASLGEAFSGKNNTTVKALKLRKYQRAIANFVKILAQKDVPVVFRGTESWTDNECVVLATDISDKNFDVSAGLALHEASHLKYTDFKVLENLMKRGITLIGDKVRTISSDEEKSTIKQILNYVEDRRIDNLVFKSSPGYKAYYHKLYDHYFRTEDIANALKHYTEPTLENYMVQMLGMLHPKFNMNALPGLREIAIAIDINNIGRLQSTEDALEVSLKVYDIMSAAVEAAEAQAQQPEAGDGEEDKEEGTPQPGGGGSSEEQEENEEQQGEGSAEGTEGAEPQEGEDQQGGAEMDAEAEEPQLTPAEERAMGEAVRQAQQLVDGNVEKKQGNHSLSNKLKDIQDSPTDITPVGEGTNSKMDCIVHEAYKQSPAFLEYAQLSTINYSDTKQEQHNRMRELRNSLPNTINYRSSEHQEKMVFEGIQLGAILGRKLLTRREERSLEQNRLRTGRIDAKRIAHAGYGIESIFNQIHIDKYKKANIHLTLDASGSMGGARWYNSIKLAAALGKAVSMIDGLELQISTRDTDGNNPMITIVYDSRVNKLGYLQVVLGYINCNSMTPEGLCLEAMLNKKLLVPTTSELDSYLINVFDGSPGFNGYGGMSAIYHTARQVKRFKNELGIKHVGFFFGSSDCGSFGYFKSMYGDKQSIAMPDASNAMQIAQHMNKELMSK